MSGCNKHGVWDCSECFPTPSRAEEKDKLTLEERRHEDFCLVRDLSYEDMSVCNCKLSHRYQRGREAGMREALGLLQRLEEERAALKAELSAAKSELNDWEGTCSRQYSEITALKKVIGAMYPILEHHCDKGPEGEGWQSDELFEALRIAREALLPPGTKGEENA